MPWLNYTFRVLRKHDFNNLLEQKENVFLRYFIGRLHFPVCLSCFSVGWPVIFKLHIMFSMWCVKPLSLQSNIECFSLWSFMPWVWPNVDWIVHPHFDSQSSKRPLLQSFTMTLVFPWGSLSMDPNKKAISAEHIMDATNSLKNNYI